MKDRGAVLKPDNKMNHPYRLFFAIVLLFTACTSSKNLNYLDNLPEAAGEQYFPMEIPDYRIEPRDILYITIKAMTADGYIEDLLLGARAANQAAYIGSESTQFLMGYNVNLAGEIVVPVVGNLKVEGLTIEEARDSIQVEADRYFKNSKVDCKLLSYRYTVLGEARAPGTYINYNSYLTILEALGKAGGISDFGRRDEVLVIRSTGDGTITYRVNLQDSGLLESEAYFMKPNDVIIVQAVKHKVFNLNLPTYSFILTTLTSTITTTLLLISFLKK